MRIIQKYPNVVQDEFLKKRVFFEKFPNGKFFRSRTACSARFAITLKYFSCGIPANRLNSVLYEVTQNKLFKNQSTKRKRVPNINSQKQPGHSLTLRALIETTIFISQLNLFSYAGTERRKIP